MVTYRNKSILIDGRPVFLLSGELHYFRQPKENWQHLIDEAKAMGLNCISSYVPWLLHEEAEGEFHFSESLDLAAFIDLCRENHLYVFIRPGPYIMAEMKKEGVPHWVFEKYPDALPVSFHGETRPCNTIDYLNEGYLSSCRSWYRKVMDIIVPRLQSNGGNIIGVQLDNEIGMLNWVTNFPVLNDGVLKRFSRWLKNEYTQEQLCGRYPFDISGSSLHLFRSPEPSWEVAFHYDYGRFMRDYYAEYVSILREYAVDCGVRGVPFFINIHGTGESRIFDFPLGVSQLYKAYNQFDDIISGTDVYLGEPGEGNYQDMYVCNAVNEAMNHGGRPLTSIEFQCSDGPYCSLSGKRNHPTAPAHQLLMCLSQNARMISYYVFAGGENYMLKYPRNDGDDRMAFTGQLHGFNAPVQPDGTHNYSFGCLSRAARAIHALPEVTSNAAQKCDDLVMAFIPDYFLTEMCDPKGGRIKAIQQNLRQHRCADAIDGAARGVLGAGCRFNGMEIDAALVQKDKAVLIFSARYMARKTQSSILSFISEGGRVLMYGELPQYDLEGNPCDELCRGLGLSEPEYEETSLPAHFVLFKGKGPLKGGIPDIPGSSAQRFKADGSEILYTEKNTMCAFTKKLGKGSLAAVTCDFPAYRDFWNYLLDFLRVSRDVTHTESRGGVYISRSFTQDGQGFFIILNLDAHEKTVDVTADGKIVYKDLFLSPKRGMLLPISVKIPCGEIEYSTAEYLGEKESRLTFGLTQKSDTIILKTSCKFVSQPDIDVSYEGGRAIIHVNKDARITPEIVLAIEE